LLKLTNSVDFFSEDKFCEERTAFSNAITAQKSCLTLFLKSSGTQWIATASAKSGFTARCATDSYNCSKTSGTTCADTDLIVFAKSSSVTLGLGFFKNSYSLLIFAQESASVMYSVAIPSPETNSLRSYKSYKRRYSSNAFNPSAISSLVIYAAPKAAYMSIRRTLSPNRA
jgi:hypothetical protein